MNKYTTGVLVTAIALSCASSVFAATSTASAPAAKPASTTSNPPATENVFGKFMDLFQNKAAVDACNGKSVGDACTFEGRKKNTVKGTCQQGKHGNTTMVCHREGDKKAK